MLRLDRQINSKYTSNLQIKVAVPHLLRDVEIFTFGTSHTHRFSDRFHMQLCSNFELGPTQPIFGQMGNRFKLDPTDLFWRRLSQFFV